MSKSYTEYYKEAKQNYDPNSKIDVNKFHAMEIKKKTINKFVKLNRKYHDIIIRLSNKIHEQIALDKYCAFKKNVTELDKSVRRFANIYDVEEIEELCQYILPQIEEKIYGCYVHVESIYTYKTKPSKACLLYTSDAADDSLRVDLGGRRIIKKVCCERFVG